MPIATIETPEGKIVKIEVPEGATNEQIYAFLSSQEGKTEMDRLMSTEQSMRSTLGGAADIIGAGLYGAGKQAIEGLSMLGGGGTPQAIESAQMMTAQLPEYQLGENAQNLITGIQQKYQQYAPELVKEIVNDFVTLGPSLGETVFQKTGSPELATMARMLPETIEAATGLAGAQAAKAPLKQAVGRVEDVTEQVVKSAPAVIETGKDIIKFNYQTPTKQRIAQLIQSGSTDKETAKYMLDKFSATGRPKVKIDPAAKEGIRQGFDEGVIASIKQASNADKMSMQRMVDIMERGKKNARYAVENRPGDVIGDMLVNRFRDVRRANRQAGANLKPIAETLRGKQVDFDPAVNRFMDDLNQLGIPLEQTATGKIVPNFKGSDIEGLAGPENVIRRVVDRMSSTQPPDAYELHRLKRYLDEQVSYGKTTEGLTGQTENVLKTLRRNLDDILDQNFPEYESVNRQYSETIQALDEFQRLIGKKTDLTGSNADKAVGVLARRVMSNAQSRANVLDSIAEIERVYNNYPVSDVKLLSGTGDRSDILTMALFADELDRVFGPVARTSFQGQIDQATQRAVRDVAGMNATEMAARAAGGIAERMRGITEESRFKSIRDILRGSSQ